MKVEIYTKENCPYCINAKVWFKNNNIPYTEFILNTNGVTKDTISKKIASLGISFEVKTVPQIFLERNGVTTHIGGYTDLQAKQSLFK